MKIGLISDTHGQLRPEAVEALQGCARIIHAGDVGGAIILERLSEVAPVDAVRNVDTDAWASRLPTALDVDAGGLRIHVVHDIADLSIDAAAGAIAAVISGHSHKPSIEWRGGVLFCNPGAAGPRRFKLPITVAMLDIDRGVIKPRIIDLAV